MGEAGGKCQSLLLKMKSSPSPSPSSSSRRSIKWVALFGLVLSVVSLFTHFLLSTTYAYNNGDSDFDDLYTSTGGSSSSSSLTIFSWRPSFDHLPPSNPNSPSQYTRLWGPVKKLQLLHPHAIPRTTTVYPPQTTTNAYYIFVRIQGGLHQIRNAICDVVVIARLLNATLVIPEIQSATSTKGISSDFKSFAYLYNEDHFAAALAKDIRVVKTLPNTLKGARRNKQIPLFKLPYSASLSYYMHRVLPVLSRHSVVELVVSEGGCLQAILPPHYQEYQRLRCRVAFHALQFRQEVQQLATKIINRLRSPGRPFIAFDPGMTREALAFYGCAELFQDVHTELIQHKRLWMIKRGIVKAKLSVNSTNQRLNGSCPLMPEEVGILLRAYGYSWDTILYISGGEVFGGQRTLIPLHAMFENIVDRTSLTTVSELSRLYGRETNLVNYHPKKTTPPVKAETKHEELKKTSEQLQRPHPLPPPPARPKYPYNIEGWWGWVAESDNEPDSTIMELRTNAHKMLWEALDYIVCVEADVFIPGFDRDGKGHPNLASMVMGQRLYQSAASKTYRPDRKEVVRLLEVTRDNLYQANRTWLTSIRQHMSRSLTDGLAEASTNSKPLSFLSHPVPECSCLRSGNDDDTKTELAGVGEVQHCPAWMGGIDIDESSISGSKDKENEEELDEDESTGIFFSKNSETVQVAEGETNNKEESQIDDPEELEGV